MVGPTTYLLTNTMDRANKKQKMTVESALLNPDVAYHMAAFLDARDLGQVSKTCKALGSNDGNTSNGLSVTEEAARRLYESASDEERAMLPRYKGESWIELYHHLLMQRSMLTFDQLVGNGFIRHGGDGEDPSTVEFSSRFQGHRMNVAALCSKNVMRSGKHFTNWSFGNGDGSWGGGVTLANFAWDSIGVMRPVHIDIADFDFGKGFGTNCRRDSKHREFLVGYLRGQRTDRWNDSNIHCCILEAGGRFHWYGGKTGVTFPS